MSTMLSSLQINAKQHKVAAKLTDLQCNICIHHSLNYLTKKLIFIDTLKDSRKMSTYTQQ